MVSDNRIINPSAQRIKYIAGDLIGMWLAFLLFNIVRYYTQSEINFYYTLLQYLTSVKILAENIFVPIVMLGICWLSGYYNNVTEKSRMQEFLTTGATALTVTAIIYLVMLINDKAPRRRDDYKLILTLFGLLFMGLYVFRLSITSYTLWKYRHHWWKKNTIIVGDRSRLKTIAHRLNDTPNRAAANIVGFCDINGAESSKNTPRFNIIENFTDIKDICETEHIDQIVIAPRRNSDKKVMNALFSLFPLNVPIKISPDELSFITSSIRLSDVYAEPMIDLSSPSMSDFQLNLKRVLDVIISLMVLILISPILILLSILVKMSSKGPVIYSQERIGFRHKVFKIYKFRSMKADAEKMGPQLSSEEDPRVTRLGKWLRKYRLDELPQFWNVLIGDMSLVGPRPEREYFINKIVKRLPYYTLLHQVRPGITSWGMVKYGYASTVDEMISRAKYDLIYISNMSIAMDLKILMHTIVTIIKGKGM